MKPFKVTLKDGREPTPEEAKYLRTLEAIINHEENAEPIMERLVDAHAHVLLYGHEPTDLAGDVCGCKVKWTRG